MADGKLSAARASATREPGRYPDGRGLYLQVTPTGARSWIFRYERAGRERMMGLGPFPLVSLAEARDERDDARRGLLKGVDPLVKKQEGWAATKAAAVREITFDDAAEAYIAAHEGGWKNAKHRYQWTATIATYASPVLGAMNVRQIDTPHVMAVLEPIWRTKTETAVRLKGRIEKVLDWSTTRGYREGLNPARWKGHLDNLLPEPSKVANAGHHAALPYAEVGGFVAALRKQPGHAAQALELTILTAVRTTEMLEAKWSEFDRANRTWTVPKERMKIKNRPDHRVPLSARAVEVLDALAAEWTGEEFVFPGARRGKPLSNMAMLAVLKRMDRRDLTVHGFRSTFKDWAAETTAHPPEVSEMALAHSVGNKVEEAYRRGDLFEKRRALMDDWAAACEPAQGSKLERRYAGPGGAGRAER